MKSELHPVCSTAACSLHPFPMNILSRAFALCCLIAASLVSITAVSAQNLPDTTRLLRFPTTNGTQIVFCYAGELYTVGKDRQDFHVDQNDGRAMSRAMQTKIMADRLIDSAETPFDTC
jgi:hypothetical protein